MNLIVLTLSIFLIGCNLSEQDIRKQIDQIKHNTNNKIEALPKLYTEHQVEYSSSKLKDPFMSFNNNSGSADLGNKKKQIQQARPDLDREREYLENFPLDSLNMVGTLLRKNEMWVLIIDRGGMLHRVKTGNYLGQNSGKIIGVTEEEVSVTEIVPDGIGGWTDRKALIKLKKK